MKRNGIEEAASVTRDFYAVSVSPEAGEFTGCVLVVSDSGPETLETALDVFARAFPEAGSMDRHSAGPALVKPAPEEWSRSMEIARRSPAKPGIPRAVIFAERRTVEDAGQAAYREFDLCLAI